MKLLYPQATPCRSLSIFMAGCELEFVPAYTPEGDLVMATALPEGEDADRVRKQARRMARVYTVVSDEYGLTWRDRPPRGASPGTPAPSGGRTPEQPDDTPPMIKAARHNGWDDRDLEGVGKDGQWGPEGGLSSTSHMSMADMALCRPPAMWKEHRDTKWPWQCEGFRPPTPEWKAPSLPDKADPRPSTPESVEVVDESTTESGDRTVAPVPEGPADLDGDPIEILREFTEEQREAALVILAKVIAEAGGERPTYHKLNYRFRKAGLPTVGADEVAALNHLYDNA